MKAKLFLVISVLFFGAAFGLLGAFSTLDSGCWPAIVNKRRFRRTLAEIAEKGVANGRKP